MAKLKPIPKQDKDSLLVLALGMFLATLMCIFVLEHYQNAKDLNPTPIPTPNTRSMLCKDHVRTHLARYKVIVGQNNSGNADPLVENQDMVLYNIPGGDAIGKLKVGHQFRNYVNNDTTHIIGNYTYIYAPGWGWIKFCRQLPGFMVLYVDLKGEGE